MYELSQKSITDINAILDWTIENFGTDAMLQYHQSLKKCFDSLSKNPDLGIKAEHIRKGYFCFYHRSHVIFYSQIRGNIFIVRILHKSMDVSLI
ncbi:ParE toxin protein [uncultured Candidatus Thioglobus sp.]|nr:ParE toxin protein [uncultured Candidatus Thioglobus sp.]